jgi:hypothetical protein
MVVISKVTVKRLRHSGEGLVLLFQTVTSFLKEEIDYFCIIN